LQMLVRILLVVCCCIVSEHGLRVDEELHSVPTRRSSDLRSGDEVGEVDALEISPDDPDGAGVRLQRRGRRVRVRGLGVVHPGDADRKSTRLNSSHVKISYAVFCLKKKNI